LPFGALWSELLKLLLNRQYRIYVYKGCPQPPQFLTS
jgi:hypothetical protein